MFGFDEANSNDAVKGHDRNLGSNPDIVIFEGERDVENCFNLELDQAVVADFEISEEFVVF